MSLGLGQFGESLFFVDLEVYVDFNVDVDYLDSEPADFDVDVDAELMFIVLVDLVMVADTEDREVVVVDRAHWALRVTHF